MGVVFMLLLAAVVAVSVWRAHDERVRHQSLERRTAIVVALDNARAQFLFGAAQITGASLAQDPNHLIGLYHQAQASGDSNLEQARAALLAGGETSQIAALDELAQDMSRLRQEVEIALAFAATADVETRTAVGQQYFPQLWPRVESMVVKLGQLAQDQQTQQAAEVAEADRAATTSLAMLIGVSAVAFLTGAAALVLLVATVLRPLGSLGASVRAITSGDLEARAAVSGPKELASLARDFNDMVAKRKEAEEALRETHERYRTLFDRSLDAVYIHDFQGRFLDANDAALRLLGYSRDEIANLSFTDLLDEPQLPMALASLDEIVKTGTQARPDTFRLKRKGGACIEVETLAAAIYEGGRPVAVQGVARDVTERKRAEEALRESRERYQELFENANDIIFTLDLAGRFTSLNKVGEQVLGYPRGRSAAMNIAQIVTPEYLARAREMTQRKLAGGGPTRYELEVIAKDGRRVPLELSTRLICHKGEPVAVQGIARDITERKQMEQAMREQARRDPLTGVLNHGAIVGELHDLISHDGDGASHAVAVVDVDGLKTVNDTFGHQVGDAVLTTVASALSRDGSIVGRYGGDEFVALVSGADRPAAERYRDAVLDAMAGASLTDPATGASVPVVASVGLAIYPMEAATIEALIKRADSEMYAAKRRRPVALGGKARAERLELGRAAKMVEEIIPLMMFPGELSAKLRLVARRLSVAAGYEIVHFGVFPSWSREATAHSTSARLPDQLVEEWNREVRVAMLHSELEHTRRPLLLNDPQHDERLTDGGRQIVRAAGVRSVLIAPMIWRDELVGTLSVASKREAAFEPRDLEFLMAVATQVTAIVHMATLVDEVQSAATRLAEARSETVVMLAAAAEAHDHTTGLHLQNVRAITEALARELGHSEKDASELGLAAVLHDIGKVRVPDTLLTSTGPLANEEWELMKHHTTWGAEFLGGRPGFELAATIAHWHHERWDASGYPDGLSGEAIPEPAAIVAVADAFDAMTSDRPYRPRRSVAAAVREIEAFSGRQFCPRVVEALLRLHKRRVLSRLRQPPPLKEEAA